MKEVVRRIANHGRTPVDVAAITHAVVIIGGSARYQSADHWKRSGVLDQIQIEFCSAGAALFGIAAHVPALMEDINAYSIDLNFGYTLTRIDAPSGTATFCRDLMSSVAVCGGVKWCGVQESNLVISLRWATDFDWALPISEPRN